MDHLSGGVILTGCGEETDLNGAPADVPFETLIQLGAGALLVDKSL
jgi:hypothetical protein